jgi:hypothetical protein
MLLAVRGSPHQKTQPEHVEVLPGATLDGVVDEFVWLREYQKISGKKLAVRPPETAWSNVSNAVECVTSAQLERRDGGDLRCPRDARCTSPSAASRRRHRAVVIEAGSAVFECCFTQCLILYSWGCQRERGGRKEPSDQAYSIVQTGRRRDDAVT